MFLNLFMSLQLGLFEVCIRNCRRDNSFLEQFYSRFLLIRGVIRYLVWNMVIKL